MTELILQYFILPRLFLGSSLDINPEKKSKTNISVSVVRVNFMYQLHGARGTQVFGQTYSRCVCVCFG